MFAQALIAFVALPGVIAIAVPVTWLWASSHTKLVQPLGLVPLLAGFFALLWCVRDFYISGKGTLAPWAPPTRLGHRRSLSLHAESHVCRSNACPSWLGTVLRRAGPVRLRSRRSCCLPRAGRAGRGALVGANAWNTVGALFKSRSSLVLVNAIYEIAPNPSVERTHYGGVRLRALLRHGLRQPFVWRLFWWIK